jgi:hypothetical protein
MRAAYGGNPAPALATTHGGAAAVTAGSAPAGQQVEQHQPDSHQSKEDEQIPHDVHCDSSTAHREGGHRLRHQQASGGGGPAARPVDSATHPPREGRWTHGQQQRAQPQQPAARQLPLDGIQRGPHRILTDLPVIQGYLALAMPTAMNS